MTIIDADTLVRDLVFRIPGASAVFEAHRIDYCCGGKMSLRQACEARAVDLEAVLSELRNVDRREIARVGASWQERSLTDLVAYIVSTHHDHTRRELARLRTPLQNAERVHGSRHPELHTIRGLFEQLEADLVPHMLKEERVLFPAIERMEAALREGRTPPPPPFGTFANPVAMMTFEHERTGGILEAIYRASNGYVVPDDACTTYAILYEGLRGLEKDLHRHIHLENDVLFPRAIELEAKARPVAGH